MPVLPNSADQSALLTVGATSPVTVRSWRTRATLAAAIFGLAGIVIISILTAGVESAIISGPEQLHLQLGPTPDVVTVSWVSPPNARSGSAAEDAAWPSIVTFGTSATELTSTAFGSSSTYTLQAIPRDHAGGFVTYTSNLIHHVELTSLQPSTVYYYLVAGMRPEDIESDGIPSFETMPPVAGISTSSGGGGGGGSRFPFTFIAMGDLGQTKDSAETVQHAMADKDARLILHAGDLSYADCQEGRWDSYFRMIEPLARRIPWMATPGNHEIEPNNLTGHIMDPFKARFHFPAVKPGVDTTSYHQDPNNHGSDCTPSVFTGSFDFGNSFYSLKAGAAHMLFLNSFTDTGVGSNQRAWLEEELKTRVDREKTPWLLAVWHSPWYNSNDGHHDEANTVAMRESMEGLLLAARVNFVLNGHVHAYERSKPVAHNVTDVARGITYINIGDGGNREGHDAFGMYAKPPWSAERNGTDYGHGRIVLLNSTHALWEWHVNGEAEWRVADSATIVNEVAVEAAAAVAAEKAATTKSTSGSAHRVLL